MATTYELDDDLAVEESSWRGRFITMAVLLLITGAAIAAAWYFFFTEEEAAARPTEDLTVAKKTINSTLLVSGTADAQLNSNLTFQSSGKVGRVDVKVGDLVRQGQVLATLESDDLANAVASAEANVLSAQLKLDDLLEGSSAAELTAAEQAAAQADALLVKAENDYQDLLDGASAADLAGAQQSVSLAESQLATAQATREKLNNTPSDADLATAQSAVAAAESALTAAENGRDNADNSVVASEASLHHSENVYCDVDGAPSFCGSPSAPISGGDAALMDAALSGANSLQASGVISANGAYMNAVNAADSADASVAAAEDALDSAQARLDFVEEGPTNEDLNAADAAVTSAEAALDAARSRLADVEDGADATQISSASAAVTSARASLESAQARLAEARRGPEANAIAQARQAVRTSQLAVEAARIRLRNAQIVSPFDGVVAAVSIAPGEFFGSVTEAPPIVLLTPDSVVLLMDVGETDYSTVKVGQGGVVLFDGIPGKPYPFKIEEIGLSPTVNQGVVTYQVKASVVILPGNPKPAPGMNGRGQLTTDSKPDIVTVPPRAIRRRGTEQVVDVRVDGNVEERVVTTGLADTNDVEILTGLAEGEVIVMPLLTTETSDRPRSEPTLPGGIR